MTAIARRAPRRGWSTHNAIDQGVDTSHGLPGTLALLHASRARPRALTAIDRLRPEMQFAYCASGVVHRRAVF